MNSWAKENYFGNGAELATRELLELVASFREKHHFDLRPKKVALFVVDCQRSYFEESSPSYIPAIQGALPKIEHLRKSFEEDLIIYTRHLNNETDAGNQRKWWREIIRKEDPGSELYFRPENGVVIEKTQYDAFYKTDLEKILKAKGIEQLVITGMMTNLCCESTARGAFDRGFEVFYVIDAMATRNYELHRASIISAAHGFALPVSTDELLKERGDDALNLN